jgi:hypothetical protein
VELLRAPQRVDLSLSFVIPGRRHSAAKTRKRAYGAGPGIQTHTQSLCYRLAFVSYNADVTTVLSASLRSLAQYMVTRLKENAQRHCGATFFAWCNQASCLDVIRLRALISD